MLILEILVVTVLYLKKFRPLKLEIPNSLHYAVSPLIIRSALRSSSSALPLRLSIYTPHRSLPAGGGGGGGGVELLGLPPGLLNDPVIGNGLLIRPSSCCNPAVSTCLGL